MKYTKSQKTRLGLFVLIGTLLLLTSIYLIGQKEDMFRNTFSITTYFKNVNGLQKGNNVRYSGINIGTVNAIEMVNDSTIRVEMSLDEKMMIHINKNAVSSIGSDGLVGNMIVNILPGQGISEPIENGDTIESFSKIGPNDVLSDLSVTVKNAEVLTEDLLRITNAINKGQGTLSVLLNDTLMASDLKLSIKNVKLAGVNASNTIDELNRFVKSIKTNNTSVLGVILNDTISGNTLKMTLNNIEESSVQMKIAIQKINKILEDINTSEGAYNYLVKDTTLVNSLESTLKNVNEGTDKFNQNMEALKHNFLTRGYFRKLEKESEKAAKKTE